MDKTTECVLMEWPGHVVKLKDLIKYDWFGARDLRAEEPGLAPGSSW